MVSVVGGVNEFFDETNDEGSRYGLMSTRCDDV
jgi:hypothetical protein